MKKVYVYGSINIDLVIKSPRIPISGETLIGNGFFINSGGKGANQAVASSKLGANTFLIGAIGCDFFGDECIETLNSFNVNTTFVQKVATNTGVAVITVIDGDNRIILDSGANYSLDDEFLKDTITNNVCENDIFVTQLETPIRQVELALKTAKNIGAITILNPAPADNLSKEILENVDILIPNESELELLTYIKINTLEDINSAVSSLINKGVKDVIVTLGSKGCYYNGLLYKAYESIVVDTTGAGDTFIGALAYRLSKGYKIEDALDFCQLASSLTISKNGAQISMPTLDEVLKIRR
jgi:ribokinase